MIGIRMKKLYLLLIILLCSHPVWAVEPIKIGFIGPLTGDFRVAGTEAKQVVELMAKTTNDRGGILSKRVEMIYEDDGGNPQVAEAAAKRLVQQGVVAVIGSFTSAMTESIQQVLDNGKIIQITYGSTAVPLTERGLANFFRICPRDDNQAKAVVRVIQKMKMKRIAMLHDDTLYGKGLAKAINTLLGDNQVSVVFYDALIPGRQDYSDILTKAKETNPDFIFFSGYYQEAAQLLISRNQMNWRGVTFMGGDAVDSSALVEIAGIKAVEGFFFLCIPMVKDLNFPQTKQFINRFERTYNNRPSSAHALLAGDAFSAITGSIKLLKTSDTALISNYLHNKYFQKDGLTGEIRFNRTGDVTNDLHAVYRVDNKGRFILQRKLQYGIFAK